MFRKRGKLGQVPILINIEHEYKEEYKVSRDFKKNMKPLRVPTDVARYKMRKEEWTKNNFMCYVYFVKTGQVM